ncbi:MAG: hypothetical protein IPG96_21610 [Proteobacteria bacterium]|nr:hypothetical protein [Pseudomonadota bacterium]
MRPAFVRMLGAAADEQERAANRAQQLLDHERELRAAAERCSAAPALGAIVRHDPNLLDEDLAEVRRQYARILRHSPVSPRAREAAEHTRERTARRLRHLRSLTTLRLR